MSFKVFVHKKYEKQECISIGCVTAAHWPYAGVSLPGGCLLLGGAFFWGVSLPGQGVPLLGGSPCQGGILAGGGGCLLPRGMPPSEGGLLVGGASCSGAFFQGASFWGASFRGVSLPGGSPCQGVPPSRRCLLPGGSPYRETPPVDRITDTSKNITLATTSLRPVKTLTDWQVQKILNIAQVKILTA